MYTKLKEPTFIRCKIDNSVLVKNLDGSAEVRCRGKCRKFYRVSSKGGEVTITEIKK